MMNINIDILIIDNIVKLTFFTSPRLEILPRLSLTRASRHDGSRGPLKVRSHWDFFVRDSSLWLENPISY